MEIRDSDIVIFSLSRHDSLISSPSYSLAKEFARSSRVFYIDHPYSVKDLLQDFSVIRKQNKLKGLLFGGSEYKFIDGYNKNLVVVTMPLTLPVNFLPEGFLYDALSKVNNKRLFKTIRSLLHEFKVKKFIYVNAFDPYFGLHFPADIRPVLKVYQSMDDLSQVAYTAKHGIRLERELMSQYDHTLVTSRQLYRLHEPFARRIHYHPNAVDGKLFGLSREKSLEIPVDLAKIKKPILGYTGAIDYRPDYTLLSKLADAHKDKSLVFIGPFTDKEPLESDLMSKPNVYFLGSKKIEELPPYLAFFDCLLIPFKCNVLTSSIYPLKVNEYLASGKPIVATNFSEDIRSFNEVVYVSEDHENFISNIDRALGENSATKQEIRIRVSNENTWEMRVKQFWQLIGS
jgi:teichuronic acid biosynthesis glycosyltransferase TuaH